jgi:hypothetical protein
MQHAIFPVGKIPYAVWEWDLRGRNKEFIAQIDEQYFEYLACVHFEAIESESRSRAALALRASYHHALETLMTFISATLQAPHCYPGWIQKASPGTVRNVVQALSYKAPLVPNALGLVEPDWKAASEAVHRYAKWEGGYDDTAGRFALAWQRLAHEWLEQSNIDEYNGIKHGLRVEQGGFSLAAGIRDNPGTPAPPERMRFVGGSEFGSRFFIAQEIVGAPPARGDPHFRIRRMSVNWSPRAMVHAMQLVSLSIGNIKSFALAFNGEAPTTVQFKRPADVDFFEELWADHPAVPWSSMDTIVTEADIVRRSREELKQFIEQQFQDPQRNVDDK